MNKPRGEYKGAWHHVYNQVISGCLLFVDDTDRRIFLQYLQDAAEKYDVKIHCAVLMDTHFHLMISTPDANMGRMMQHLKSRYTKKFNRRHGRRGALFCERYGNEPIETREQQLEVHRYIHNNPVKAGMTKRAEDYLWSTMAAYLGLTKKPPWLTTEDILAEHGNSTERLLRFTNDRKPKNSWNPDTPRDSRYSEAFLQRIAGGPGTSETWPEAA